MSPWVATTRLSFVATMTLQPVPQKRHGALSHVSSLAARSVTTLAPSAGADIPPAAIAIAAASSFSTCRRSSFSVVMSNPSAAASGGIVGVKDERGREHVRQQRDGVEGRSDGAGARRLDDDHELALRVARVDLATAKRHDG